MLEPTPYYERTILSRNDVSKQGSIYKTQKGDTGAPETSSGSFCVGKV